MLDRPFCLGAEMATIFYPIVPVLLGETCQYVRSPKEAQEDEQKASQAARDASEVAHGKSKALGTDKNEHYISSDVHSSRSAKTAAGHANAAVAHRMASTVHWHEWQLGTRMKSNNSDRHLDAAESHDNAAKAHQYAHYLTLRRGQ